jgi:aromatic-L-amino-acid decarboxylase
MAIEQPITGREQSLDPEDWNEFRALGHTMLDHMIDYIRTVRERPVWKKPSRFALNSMDQPLPEEGQPLSLVYEDFLNNVLPFNTNNIHPSFWAWVQGGGTPSGMLADMLASAMNSNVSIGEHMPMYVEKQVIEWSKKMMGFPEDASGILTSGGSVANITALLAARQSLDEVIKSDGVQALEKHPVMYGSAETHNCVLKAAEVIGIGNRYFKRIGVDEHQRINIAELESQIIEDIAAGLLPFCIIGNAGTVNTGAIDPLAELSSLAKKYGMWFHVDGAFGAVPKLLPEFSDQLKGIETADSLSFDFHKWMYVNYEVGCVLIRNRQTHRDTFSSTVNYLSKHEHGLSAGPDPYNNYGLELSRGFKALKVWMSLKEFGLEKYRTLIRQNIDQARFLAALVRQNKNLELFNEPELNVVCFRYVEQGMDQSQLNALNKEILMELHMRGLAAPSYTMIDGTYLIRVAHTNHRSTKADFVKLVNDVVSVARDIKTVNPVKEAI